MASLWVPAASPAKHPFSDQELQYFRSVLGKKRGDPQCSPRVRRANTMVTVSLRSQQLGKLLNKTQQPPARQTQQFKHTCFYQP